jgi:hypothetical protein
MVGLIHGGREVNDSDVERFRRITDGSEFLFDKATQGFFDDIRDILHTAHRIKFDMSKINIRDYDHGMDEPNLKVDKRTTRELSPEEREVVDFLDNFMIHLDAHFDRYLNLSKIGLAS